LRKGGLTMQFAIRGLGCAWLWAFFVHSALSAQTPLPTDQWPAGVAPRNQLSQARALAYEFNDVDVDNIEAWLKWINIEFPIDTAGRLSGWLWAQPRERAWLAFRDYRIEGEISSEELQLDGYVVRQAALRFGYVGGHWYVGRLRGEVRPVGDSEVIGDVQIVAKIPTRGDQQLQSSGRIDRARLSPLLRSLGVELDLTNSTGQLSFAGSVPLASADDLRAWSANAAVDLQQVKFQEFPPGNLSASAGLRRGSWTMQEGIVHWLGEPLTIQGAGQLGQTYPYDFVLTGQGLSLERSLTTFGLAELANAFSGFAEVRASLAGDGTRGIAEAGFEAQAAQLFFREQRLSAVEVGVRYRPESVELSLRNATHASGRFQGQILWDDISQLAQGIPNSLQLRVDSLQLEQLAPHLRPLNLEGIVSGDIRFASPSIDSPRRWSTQAVFNVAGLTADSNEMGEIQVHLSKALESERLDINLDALHRSFAGQLSIDLQSSDPALQSTQIVGYQGSAILEDFSWRLPALTNDQTRTPVRLTGTVQLQGSPQQWLQSGRAELQSAQVFLAGEMLQLQSAIAVLTPERFSLEQFLIIDSQGAQFSGSGYWESWQDVMRRLPVETELRLQNFRLENLTSKLPVSIQLAPLQGVASGGLHLSSQSTDEHTAWASTGQIQIENFSISHAPAENVRLQWTKLVEQGELAVQAQTIDQAFSARAIVMLENPVNGGLRHTQPTSYRATGQLQDFSTVWQPPIADWPNVPAQVSGDFQVEGTSENWIQQGSASLDRVLVSWEGQPIELRTAVLHVLPDHFRLERFQIFDPRGRIAGAAVYRRDNQQIHQINLRIVNADLAAYANLLPDERLRDIEGTMDLEMRLSKSAEDAEWYSGWAGKVAANLHDLHYRGDSIGDLSLRGDILDEQLTASLNGTVLGGRLV
jgi:hypothetical protein